MKDEKKQKRSWLSLLVGLITITLAIGYVIINRKNLMETSQELELIWLLPMFPFAIFMLALNGFSLALFVRLFDIYLRPIEWFSISVTSSFTNYIAPLSAGLFVRAGYLKERYSFSYTRFAVISLSFIIISISVTALLGLILTLVALVQGTATNILLIGFFTAVLVAALIPIVFPLNPAWFEKFPFSQLIMHALEGWEIIKRNTRFLISQIILVLANVLSMGLMVFFAFRAIGNQVPLLHAIVMGLFLSLSLLVRITPGNIGLQEGILGLVSSLIHLPLEVGLFAGLVVRLVMIIVVFVQGPITSYFLTQRLQQKSSDSPPV